MKAAQGIRRWTAGISLAVVAVTSAACSSDASAQPAAASHAAEPTTTTRVHTATPTTTTTTEAEPTTSTTEQPAPTTTSATQTSGPTGSPNQITSNFLVGAAHGKTLVVAFAEYSPGGPDNGHWETTSAQAFALRVSDSTKYYGVLGLCPTGKGVGPEVRCDPSVAEKNLPNLKRAPVKLTVDADANGNISDGAQIRELHEIYAP